MTNDGQETKSHPETENLNGKNGINYLGLKSIDIMTKS